MQVALLQIRGGRFIVVTASRKFHRSFIGAFLPDVFSEIYQLFSNLSYSLRGWAIRVLFLCQLVHLDAFHDMLRSRWKRS